MRKILLLIALLPIGAIAQRLPFLIDIRGGYSSATISAEDYKANGSGFSSTITTKGGSGTYFGLGIGTRGTRRPGIHLSAAYQSYGVKYHTSLIQGSSTTDKESKDNLKYLQLTPSVFFSPSVGPVKVLVGAGLPVNISMNSNYKTFVGAEIKAGAGFKGIMVTAAYQIGLNNSIDINQLPSGAGLTKNITGKTNVLNVGIMITPQLFL